MKQFFISLCLGMSVSIPAFSQKFKNVEIRLEGSLVQVNYELDGFEYGQLYEVHAYASHNDFAVPLQFVKGDVGQKVKGDGNIKKSPGTPARNLEFLRAKSRSNSVESPTSLS
jgi:hypothetical protein